MQAIISDIGTIYTSVTEFFEIEMKKSDGDNWWNAKGIPCENEKSEKSEKSE